MKNIASIILIVTSIAISVFYTNKSIATIKEVRVQNGIYQKALDKTLQIRKKREKLEDDYNKISEQDREKIKKIVPDSIDNIQLLVDIDNIALKKGMRIKNAKIEEEKVSKDQTLGPQKSLYSSISLSFNTSATYDTFLAFLDELDKSQRIVDVTALSFKTNDTGIYDYSMTIRTYWLKQTIN